MNLSERDIMAKKVEYEFKTDKNDHKYALRVDLTTGKKSRINYKLAKKRAGDNKYRRGRVVVEKKLVEEGAGATYQEYVKSRDEIRLELIKKSEKEGTKPPTKQELKRTAKRRAIKDRTGIATRLRFAWTYTIRLDTVKDPDTNKLVNICDSPAFSAYGKKWNGDEFGKPRDKDGNYYGAIGICEKELNNILANGLCTLDGGACVLLYDKGTKEILKKHELGKGCGFSFDFENYHEDTNILKAVLKRNKKV